MSPSFTFVPSGIEDSLTTLSTGLVGLAGISIVFDGMSSILSAVALDVFLIIVFSSSILFTITLNVVEKFSPAANVSFVSDVIVVFSGFCTYSPFSSST